MPQSMPPSTAIAARRCSSGISLGCTVKPSGSVDVRVGDPLDDLEVDRGRPAASRPTRAAPSAARCPAGALVGDSVGASRVSVKTFSSWPW